MAPSVESDEEQKFPNSILCTKVWLTTTARVPCINAANIGERKTWMQTEFAPGRILLGDNGPQNVYIVYQPRSQPNIVQSLVGLHWETSVQ